VGDIVLVGHDNLKRLDWPLARVVKVFPGRDGVTRVVRVRTATGELVRPVQRLYPLEISLNPEDTIKQNLNTVDRNKDGEEESKQVIRKEVRTRSGRRVKVQDRFSF